MTDSSQESSTKIEPLNVEQMPQGASASPKSSSAFQWLLLVLIVLVMGATAVIAVLLYNIHQDYLRESAFQTEQVRHGQSQRALIAQVDSLKAQGLEDQAAITELKTDLKLVNAQIAGISGVNRVDWLVDEVQHLTRLAHQRLVLSHDAKGAIALLKAADQVAIEMRLSSALSIRQAIADDLLDLRLAANNDLEGAYIRLDTLSKKIETLSFRKPSYPSQNMPSDAEDMSFANENLEDQLGGAFSHVLKKLQPYLFRSFRIDGEMKPMLNGEERQYLSRNMQLAIEEAQLALLRREPESYRLSLEQSEKWIRQYYDTSDPLTSTVLAILAELKSYRLNPEMPEITKTLSAVKTFSENWKMEKQEKKQLRRSLSQ